MRRAVSLAPLLLSACALQRGEPPAPPILPLGESAQRSVLPADPFADARRALAERVASKERRFREALQPGSLWRGLRLEQADLRAGRVPQEALLEAGRDLFSLDIPREQGLGNGLAARRSPLAGPRPAPNLRHVQYKEFGGPDATRCLSCHFVGGEGGGGFRADNAFLDGDGVRPSSALERNPRALPGAALVQLLAEQMSAELARGFREARDSGKATPATALGVSFGTLRVSKGGAVDPKGLVGVDADLVVKPFGWKGTTATLREAIEDNLQRHLGLTPERWVSDAAGRPRWAQLGDGPDPTDPDQDGVRHEATDGMVTALSAYLAALAPPVEQPPEDASFLLRASRGAERFQQLGCASCHTPELTLKKTVLCLGPRGEAPCYDLWPLLRAPGQAPPRPGESYAVRLYSDLKRHDMGDSLAEPRDYRGVSRREWLTPPLWGVSGSAPYLHDGRAGNLPAAILAHDGEALAARKAYEKLPMVEQGELHLFLSALDRPHHLEFKR